MTDPTAGPTGLVHAAFETAAPMIAFLSGDPLSVTACNASARARLGVRVGTPASDALSGEDLDELAVRLPEMLGSATPFVASGVTVPLLDGDGGPATALVDVHAEPVRCRPTAPSRASPSPGWRSDPARTSGTSGCSSRACRT